jgi:hypothetical protein
MVIVPDLNFVTLALYGPGYVPPLVRAKFAHQPPELVRLPNSRTFGTRLKCKSSEPGQGMTNGMPWVGASPIVSAPSNPMAKPARPAQSASATKFKARLARAGLPK